MTEQWEKTKKLNDKKEKGYNNKPGTCAGAKLIGKSGHVAHSMTEIFFSFTGDGRKLEFDVIYRGPAEFAPSSGLWTPPSLDALKAASGLEIAERRSMRRRNAETVPSCKTCQDTLFMARCDLNEQSCK